MPSGFLERPKTYFVDVDGTVLQSSSWEWKNPRLPMNAHWAQWSQLCHKEGHKIILVTARTEAYRAVLEDNLRHHGFVWDQLIMGTAPGQRILIDNKPCAAIQQPTNEGCRLWRE